MRFERITNNEAAAILKATGLDIDPAGYVPPNLPNDASMRLLDRLVPKTPIDVSAVTAVSPSTTASVASQPTPESPPPTPHDLPKSAFP